MRSSPHRSLSFPLSVLLYGSLPRAFSDWCMQELCPLSSALLGSPFASNFIISLLARSCYLLPWRIECLVRGSLASVLVVGMLFSLALPRLEAKSEGKPPAPCPVLCLRACCARACVWRPCVLRASACVVVLVVAAASAAYCSYHFYIC